MLNYFLRWHMPSTLFQKELEAFPHIRPGHFVSWFARLSGGCSSEITCVSCGAVGNVSTLGGSLGLIFVAECEEVRSNPELLALVSK
jgi:hypothetical protein